jgi:small subunit ribosomal protein S21
VNAQQYRVKGVIHAVVRARKNEDIESLIRRFKKKVSKAGITKEVRDKMYYEKPSDKRRRKKAQSIRNLKREEAKQEQREEKYKKMSMKRKRKESKRNDRSKHQSRRRQSNRDSSEA